LTSTGLKFTAFFILVVCQSWGQINLTVDGHYIASIQLIQIEQLVEYTNQSDSTLDVIYLHDWNNSYSSNNTDLAIRFQEEFISAFHFENDKDRGYTDILKVTDNEGIALDFGHDNGSADFWKIQLNTPLRPGDKIKINLNYNLRLPNNKFTGYGADADSNVYLKNWILWPAVYDDEWVLQTNKNLDDLYAPEANISLTINTDVPMYMYSDLVNPDCCQSKKVNTTTWIGSAHHCTLILKSSESLKVFESSDLSIATDYINKGLSEIQERASAEKVIDFLTGIFGKITEAQLPITKAAGEHSPIYGFDRLPSFLHPYPDELQFELELVKQITHNALDGLLDTNPRKEYWLQSGIETYVLMLFVEEHYPDLKLLGSFSEWWGVRTYNLAKQPFNGQYKLFYEQMARTNRDQSLSTPKDSLLKINQTFVNPYKAGLGFKYIDNYAGQSIIRESISAFFKEAPSERHNIDAFRSITEAKTNKSLDWFFEEYINNNDKLDLRVKRVKNKNKQLQFKVYNHSENGIPFEMEITGETGKKTSQWLTSSILLTDPNIHSVKINPSNTLSEVKYSNNSAFREASLFSNRPFKIKLLTDIEEPGYDQFFITPIVEYGNIYDGLSLGAYFTNNTILKRPFRINLTPQFATKSKIITGRGSFTHYYNRNNAKLYNINSGIYGGYNSIGINMFSRIASPFISLKFREPKDLRSNKRQEFNLRYISIFNDAANNTNDNTPNYGVFNLRLKDSDKNLFDFKQAIIDTQLSNDFGKISLEYQYRKLSGKNHQFNLRLFAGAFLYHNAKHTTFFDFSLDRPSDYLFDYNYLGRSESSGFFSQQINISDGGFKSILDPRTANQWMTTANLSASIFRWIEWYGDIGFSKNMDKMNPFFAYDAGLRLNFIPDYFELYFPFYSNLGWEIAQDSYFQKIRFVITTSPRKLSGLFQRKWF